VPPPSQVSTRSKPARCGDERGAERAGAGPTAPS
jgi:hypothetical protein